MLATLSARATGWPFASLAPFALSDAGEPLLLLSDLAEHTRNLRADPRASLLVQDSTAADDPQAGARVTLLGTATRVPADQTAQAQARYLARHPRAASYVSMADFHLWRLHVTEGRFVNGFGAMGWLSGERLRQALTDSP